MLITLFTAIFPKNRFLRILAFIAFLQITALPNSFGKINHDMHLWASAGFFFIFLPKGDKISIAHKHQYLTAFLGTQVLILNFYTSSGVWKMAGAAIQLVQGEMHAFHPFALSQHIANRLLQTNFDSIIGGYLVDHPYIGWPLFAGAILLELFAVIAAFRPKLHFFWGLSILLMHLGIWLTLHVPFVPNILFMLVFFVNSPFHPEKLTGKDVILSLPILGDLLVAIGNRFNQLAKPNRPKDSQWVPQQDSPILSMSHHNCVHCRTPISKLEQTMCANCAHRFGNTQSQTDHPTILSPPHKLPSAQQRF